MDARFVRERVRADDRLVPGHVVAGQPLDEPRGRADLRRVDPSLGAERVPADADRHHDLLERGVAGPLADPVDRALDLADARVDRGERVRDREAEIVVAVRREGHAGDLGAETPHLVEEAGVLHRQREADGIGKVDDRGAGPDRRPADLGDERWIRPRRVLARELDLVHVLARVPNGPVRMLDDLGGLELQLLLHVDGARGEEDVDPGAPRVGERLRPGLDVLLTGAAERCDRGAAGAAGDGLDSLEIAGRGHCEAGLDHFDSEELELLRDLDLLVRLQRDARRLLAVAKRGVEDCDPARTH